MSDGDVVGVETCPAVLDGELCRELRLPVPMAVTAGEIKGVLDSLQLPVDAPLLRSETRQDFPKRMVLVFPPGLTGGTWHMPGTTGGAAVGACR